MSTTLHSSQSKRSNLSSGRAASFVRSIWVKKSARFTFAGLGALLVSAGIVFTVFGQSAVPNIAVLGLSADPLFTAPSSDKPAIALALSVEYPTVGAQYREKTYNVASEYLGYYDAESCYRYNNTPSEVASSAANYSDYKRFDKIGQATSRKCAGSMDGFSGNFLNFASSSSIDMLRLALSGGDRLIDTTSQTILQRAVLSNGDPICMWNDGSTFPAKVLPRDAGNYLGAVPTLMRNQANTSSSDIQIANTLNQIFFGTVRGGGCNNTSTYQVGVATPQVLGRTYGPGVLPTGFSNITPCANGSACGTSGMNEVLYGRAGRRDDSRWVSYVTFGPVVCNATNFPGGTDNAGAECFAKPYTGTAFQAPTTSASLNTDGFFYARVQVCNVDTAGRLLDQRDYNFCTLQASGKYKPTGSIQKYSDQLRLSAFGYLMDQTSSQNGGRYGGVLRTPMKYVGAKTFDESGGENTPSGGNPRAEWDAVTGIFTANPDSDTTQATPISGVINYLNKFGRTGPVPGRYKIYDAVGEMYGESLRYLQGLGPTAEAVSNLTDPRAALFDGFPVFTTWTDPYGGTRSPASDYSCMKSNIVVVGDVNTWDGRRLFTRPADVANNLPDFSAWQNVVTAFESNNNLTYTDGQGVNRTTGNPNTPNSAGVSSAGGDSVIVGQAYWARTQDIRGTNWTGGTGPAKQRPGLRVKSFFFDVNENGSGSDMNYRRTANQFFRASKYGGFETDASNSAGNPYNTYGNPFKRQDGTNDNNVWQDQANPGEAGTYYLSSSARATLAAFDGIFGRAATAARSIARVAVANKNLTSAGSAIYQASFDTTDWSGDVLSTPITLTGTTPVISPTPAWTAASRLANVNPVSRNIVIGRDSSTAIPAGTPFLWASLDSAMQNNLSKSTPVSTTDTLGEARVNYLRGDRSNESTTFRPRKKLLGDIVNSGVVYSGSPTTNITPGTAAYSSFYSNNAGRTPAVFAGANDGMLHAFNANTGDELFGYIPSWMGSKLSALTSKNYNGNHQAYVDASPSVGEAQVGTLGDATDWKTVLVSGTGPGGPGVFALDVTDPTAFSASKVLWEFTKADDADMGYVVGRTQILKMRTSAPGVVPATFRWFAAVASGVNNYLPFPTAAGPFSATGKPAIFLLALDKPVGTAWTASGTSPNYYKLSLPTDAALAVTNPTGIVNFAPVFGAAREVTQMYFGDLHGKVWKLDFQARGSAQWTFDFLSFFKAGTAPATTPLPMYIAKNAAGAIQPITMTPNVLAADTNRGVSNRYVVFGTGKFLESNDKTSVAQNSFYVLYDNTATGPTTGAAVIPSRARLQQGSVNNVTKAVSVAPFTFGRPSSDSDTSSRAGWFFDYATTGERNIAATVVDGNFINFSTLIPTAAGAAGTCASGGTSNIYELDVDNGTGTLRRSTVGIVGDILLFNTPGTTTYGPPNSTGRRVKTITPTRTDAGTSGLAVAPSPSTQLPAGRLSWRQINNYQDLKNAP